MKKHKNHGYKEVIAGTYSSKKELLPGLSKSIEASSKTMHVHKKHKSKYY